MAAKTPPQPSVRAPVRPALRAPRAGAFLAAKATALDEALGAAEPRVLAHTDSEAVHDLRVALRRLRTLLKLARPVFGAFHTDAVRQAFADLQTSTGDLRDEEALEGTLADLAVPHAPFVVWRERRRARERRLRRSLVVQLKEGELVRARALLRALLLLPIRPDRDPALSKFARKMVQRAQRGVESRRDTPADDVVGLHDLRIAYKKLRYAVEIFSAALPADLAAMAEPAARFQKRLGDLHDLDVAKLALARARGMAPDTRVVVLAALDVAREKKLAKYVAEMAPAEPVLPAIAAPAPVRSVPTKSARKRSTAKRAPSRPAARPAARKTKRPTP